ncbi:unnamed protein product [Ceutorhynchus assimilis]|uniref:Uncharacterized protein n=1 Tax=Ceutorhynchus assimilis TaxID=467358 RepID=A0A9N9MX83_9CUCU|nr:unnamed protein product [Ceutorhynchus assimilis]
MNFLFVFALLLSVAAAAFSQQPVTPRREDAVPVITRKVARVIINRNPPVVATKFVIFFASLLGLTYAGYLGEPLGYHAPLVAAPIIKTVVPVATSYQNIVQISAAPVPIVVKAAPVSYAHAPAIVKGPLLAAPLPYSYH